jgi:hypothetical protein
MKGATQWICAFAVAGLLAGPAAADYLVTFQSGSKLRIDSYRREQGWFLIPTAGGELGVPEAEISSVVPMEAVEGDAPLVNPESSEKPAASKPRVTPRPVAGDAAAEADANPFKSLIDRLKSATPSGGDTPEPGADKKAAINQPDVLKERMERLKEMSSRASDPAMKERFDRMIEALQKKSEDGATAMTPYQPTRPPPAAGSRGRANPKPQQQQQPPNS